MRDFQILSERSKAENIEKDVEIADEDVEKT